MVLDIGVWVAYGPCVAAIPPGRAVAQRGKANIIRLPGAQVPLTPLAMACGENHHPKWPLKHEKKWLGDVGGSHIDVFSRREGDGGMSD